MIIIIFNHTHFRIQQEKGKYQAAEKGKFCGSQLSWNGGEKKKIFMISLQDRGKRWIGGKKRGKRKTPSVGGGKGGGKIPERVYLQKKGTGRSATLP